MVLAFSLRSVKASNILNVILPEIGGQLSSGLYPRLEVVGRDVCKLVLHFVSYSLNGQRIDCMLTPGIVMCLGTFTSITLKPF